jgi:hypothetical protein
MRRVINDTVVDVNGPVISCYSTNDVMPMTIRGVPRRSSPLEP